MTEAELIHLRKEILLMGELQLKYKEKLQHQPQMLVDKQQLILSQTVEHEMMGMYMYKGEWFILDLADLV